MRPRFTINAIYGENGDLGGMLIDMRLRARAAIMSSIACGFLAMLSACSLSPRDSIADTEYTNEQVIGALQDCENGAPAAMAAHQNGVDERTLAGWRRNYGGRGLTFMRLQVHVESTALAIQRRVDRALYDGIK